MSTNRRDFIKGTAWMGLLAASAGCTCEKIFGCSQGGSMQGFALPPMKEVRVAVIGIGGRGTGAVHRVTMIPGVKVAAICDKKPEQVQANLKWFVENRFAPPKAYCGEEAWKKVCDWDGCNVVYIATPWALHAPIAKYAMECGKVALVEVPSALTVDECWDLVETSEKTRIPCMMLENCCYGEMEMLGLSLAQQGVLGEIVHAEGAYIHDLRRVCDSKAKGEAEWRYHENRDHKGNRYPTHGLVPLMQAMNINRGDRFDYLVSLESQQANCKAWMDAMLGPNDVRRNTPMEMGDMNVTLIKTALGKSIMVQHDVSSPRPYSRINLLSGTKGVFWGMPWRVYSGKQIFKVGLEDQPGNGVHAFFDDAKTEALRRNHMHPLWKKIGEIAQKVGGHGGMDFIMDLRWAYCLQNGLPLDIDVYDLASTNCLCELTEKSVRDRSSSVDVPDFTRGGWQTAAKLGDLDIDLKKLDFDKVRKDEAALNV